MLKKPDTCKGCPLYGDGQGFVPDERVAGAKLLVLMQAPGATEEREGRPACGPTGDILNTHFLPLAGLERGRDVSVANVLRCRQGVEGGVGKSDALPPHPTLHTAVRHCNRAHLSIPASTTHIVAQGALAASYCAGTDIDIGDWRGFALRAPAVGLPTYVVAHLASLLHDPKMWWVAELDWRKIPRWVACAWPVPVPPYTEITDANIESTLRLSWERLHTLPGAYLVTDTEYVGSVHVADPGYLTEVGVAVVSDGRIQHGYHIDWRSLSQHSKGRFAAVFRDCVTSYPVVVQNYAADLPILKRFTGVDYNDYYQVDDTMLAHAVLHCELPHTLKFLSSLYSPYGEHKTYAGTGGGTYNWGDVCSTAALKEALWKEFSGDTQAYGIYSTQSRALIPITLEAMERGILVDRNQVLTAYAKLQAQARMAQMDAECYLGYPINLGSDDQIAFYAYTIRGLAVQKHPRTKRPTVDTEAVDCLRDGLGPPVVGGSDIGAEYARRSRDGDPVLEGRVLYAYAQHQIDAYVYGLLKGVHDEANGPAKTRCRNRVAKEGLTLDDLCEVIHPQYAIHAQRNARWSTTDPPLAQLPKQLRSILIPRPGYIMVGWDWKGIELRILEAESRSAILAKAHNDGIDLHTWTCCRMFGWELPSDLVAPHTAPVNSVWRAKYGWQGPDDPRRVFAKSARYEMNYGGYGGTAARKAVGMGLKPTEVRLALGRLLTSDGDYYRWRAQVEQTVRSSRIIRTFLGRPRRFITVGRGGVLPASVVREALDYPMQAAVSDIYNLTIIEISRALPSFRYVWGMHDSQYWEVPRAQWTPDAYHQLHAIVEKEWDIKGYKMRFPADFKVMAHPGESL